MPNTDQDTLEALSKLQNNSQLSILKISEPLLQPAAGENQQQQQEKRSSDVSSSGDASDTPTPASLEVDLAHYKELFTKLRFSYLEQVTKEKFLRSLIESPLPSIPHTTLATLETQLAATKTTLQAQKAAVAELVDSLENQSRELSRRYMDVQSQAEELQTLPGEIARLREDIASLRLVEEEAGDDGNPDMTLPLAQTLDLVGQREAELDLLDRQVSAAAMLAESKSRELNLLEAELGPLQSQKVNLTAAAKEARRRREAGVSGIGDELELQGRWYRGVETVMRSMLVDA